MLFCSNNLFISAFNPFTTSFKVSPSAVIYNLDPSLGTKRVLFGHFFKSVMPDMYNDSTVHSGLIWGRIIIDTVKEKILLTNIDPNALSEIEDHITEGMAKMKCQSAIDCKNQSEGRC